MRGVITQVFENYAARSGNPLHGGGEHNPVVSSAEKEDHLHLLRNAFAAPLLLSTSREGKRTSIRSQQAALPAQHMDISSNGATPLMMQDDPPAIPGAWNKPVGSRTLVMGSLLARHGGR